MKEIKLTQGKVALIDDEDYEMVSKLKWYAMKTSNKFYVASSNNKYLHRFIMNVTDSNIKVDHINGDTLDNRRSNLRLCSHRENIRNCVISKNNTIGYKGIWIRNDGRKKKYAAEITFNYKRIKLGSFYTLEEAAEAYNEAALKYHGEYSNLNIINNK